MRLLFALPALLLATPALAEPFPVTVRSCDRDVTFEAAPQRAVSNDVNLTEMMLALGLTDHMVGVTGISGWNKIEQALAAGIELPELAPQYPSREVLLGADADFYFAGWNYGMRVGGDVTPETLGQFGIAVYELTESCIHIMDKPKASLEDLDVDLRNLSKIFGVPERGEALVEGYEAELAAFEAGREAVGEPVRAFVYDSGEDRVFTAGRYGMPTALIEAAGGVNIADDVAANWVEIGWEAVIERAPEVIVIVNYGNVTAEQKRDFMMTNPAFADIPAVRNDRFVTLEYVEATPGPRNIAAIKRLAEAFAAR
ncbi:ABC transporter substrate-binding protein [Arsenicitalea aurantiaca]|uniref:ABC transporter substrate-binding protein n=1 Tax=Arsenicitalea aurantiaca TaxID=1783274 RepID=A0A433X5N2_9HYPH|nr:ABC transporter substrate-binding protein [Arsenicitalea aurantiaca]RUT29390.1 ABC transporter substrate-binding protein [Arsenicitalea aurantiaca]